MDKKLFVSDEGKLDDQPENDPFIEEIKKYILENYHPVKEAKDADIRMTTLEIYTAVLQLYPTENFSMQQLSSWLNEKGFTFFDAGKMRFEWLFKTDS